MNVELLSICMELGIYLKTKIKMRGSVKGHNFGGGVTYNGRGKASFEGQGNSVIYCPNCRKPLKLLFKNGKNLCRNCRIDINKKLNLGQTRLLK